MNSPNPKNKKGFTLIELLIVVVIIGILAAIAIPRFGETRERAFESAVVSDLRNLQTVQEQWYADPANEFSYATMDQLATANLFSPGDAVAIELSGGGEQGYVATATHTALTGSCVVVVGDEETDNSVDATASNGQIACSWGEAEAPEE